jgi:NAD(P)H-dependent FMN reductase
MRFLALSGSLRAGSTNAAALEAARRLAPAGVDIVLYRGLAALPHFNPDDDEDQPPPAVAALRAEVRASAGLVIAMPEYAHGVPGALKNALDWLVGSDAIPGKPVMLINAAPRAFHAQAALREILSTMAARLVAEAFVTLPLPGGAIDANAILGDPRLSEPLRDGLLQFVTAIAG